jgi:HSP20 family protein
MHGVFLSELPVDIERRMTMLPVCWNESARGRMTGGPINPLNSIFDRVFGGETLLGDTSSLGPMAMWEDDDHVYVEVELPGMTDKDMDITVHNGMLFIRGERKPDEGRTYVYQGRCYGRFEQAITLPEAVATDNVQAELKDGVLTITLPKRPGVKPRKIALKTSDRPWTRVTAALVTMAIVLLAAIGSAH